jgi:hypothetical protein
MVDKTEGDSKKLNIIQPFFLEYKIGIAPKPKLISIPN